MNITAVLDAHAENHTFHWYRLQADERQLAIYGQIKDFKQLFIDLREFNIESLILENYGDFYDLTNELHFVKPNPEVLISTFQKCSLHTIRC